MSLSLSYEWYWATPLSLPSQALPRIPHTRSSLHSVIGVFELRSRESSPLLVRLCMLWFWRVQCHSIHPQLHEWHVRWGSRSNKGSSLARPLRPAQGTFLPSLASLVCRASEASYKSALSRMKVFGSRRKCSTFFGRKEKRKRRVVWGHCFSHFGMNTPLLWGEWVPTPHRGECCLRPL